jgi:hypothetical protein
MGSARPPLFGAMPVRIVEDSALVVFDREDWSRVRSPGRAARRRKKHRQNIVTLYKPDPKVIVFGDTYVMHPALAAEFRRATLKALEGERDG